VGTGGGEADGSRSLQVPEDGDAGLCVDGRGVGGGEVGGAAAANAQELDFRHDESVAATVFAHYAMEMGEALQIEDLLGRRLATHARVPLIVALYKTDDAAAAVAEDCLLVISRVVGDKLWLLALTGNGLDGAHVHVRSSLGYLERGVDLVRVVVCANVLQGGLVLGLQVLAARLGKVGGWDRDFEQGKHGRNGLDGGDVEVLPAAKVADVPPEVVVDAAGRACDAANQGWGGIRGGEVFDQGRGRWDLLKAIKVDICKGRVLDGWRRLEFWEDKVGGASRREAGNVLDG